MLTFCSTLFYITPLQFRSKELGYLVHHLTCPYWIYFQKGSSDIRTVLGHKLLPSYTLHSEYSHMKRIQNFCKDLIP